MGPYRWGNKYAGRWKYYDKNPKVRVSPTGCDSPERTVILDLSRNDKAFLRTRLPKWHNETSKKPYPWRTTKNHWHAIIAEIMLQRTNVDQVMPVYNQFVTRFPTPQSFTDACRSEEMNCFQNLGLVWRNRLLFQLAEQLAKEGIPSDKKGLMRLPGVGDYIASAFRSMHLNKREAIIDSNIVRFYGRYFGFPTEDEKSGSRNLL